MTKLPDDDRELTNFLRRYRSQPPPSPSDLEEQVMIAIAQVPVPKPIPRPRFWYQSPWMPPVAIAASLITGLMSYRTLVPSLPNQAELATLEAFIESNWYSTVNNDASDDPFLLEAISLAVINDESQARIQGIDAWEAGSGNGETAIAGW